ncbi:MAG: hypothetical protein L3J43_07520 [Sulfurovum sp.]|nr:hypothetical protein [Sulfurovum sp.]
MENEELLALYLEKLRLYSLETLEAKEITVLEALKASLVFIEGEMHGY